MANRVPITVRLEAFEGPLDLLLYLIQSHEMDISKISIGAITDQYLAYVRLMQELNFDIASDFLVMAATLLHWKSKTLLPQENKVDPNALLGEDVISQEDLIRQLLEHQRFLAAGADLDGLPLLGEDVFTRPNRRPPIEKVWKEMSVTDLATTYQDMLVKARKRTTVLRKETVSISDKIIEFSDRLKIGKLTEFAQLLSALSSRPEVVVTFLASLELSRLKKMKIFQEGVYQPIFVELLETLRNFDISLASGFNYDLPAPTEASVAAADAIRFAAQAQAKSDSLGIPLPDLATHEFHPEEASADAAVAEHFSPTPDGEQPEDDKTLENS